MTRAADLQRVRDCLSPRPGDHDAIVEDGAIDQALTPAAVLFPIVLHAVQPTVLLTQRTDHLRDHAGQISFPGGRIEPNDEGPMHAALREAEEEIGLSPQHVEVVGYLPDYRTSTGFRVTPVVAFVTPPFELRLDPFEVADAFEVPLAFLLDPANHQEHQIHWRGALRRYHAMPYGERFIWGATAGMILSLWRRLAVGAGD